MEKNEQILKYFPFPIKIEKINTIIEQMKNYICKIKNINGEGTGFFCYILSNNIKIPVLITSNHLVNGNIIKQNKILKVTLNDGKEYINIELLDNKKIYTNEKYGLTIIDILPEIDNINHFLEIDEFIFQENQNIFNEKVYIIYYPKCGKNCKASVSYGIANKINSEIKLFSNINVDFSGSPIVRLSSHKVIGINEENNNLIYHNNLKNAINEYLNNINLIKIESKKISLNQFPEIINTVLGPETGENEEEENNKSELIKINE